MAEPSLGQQKPSVTVLKPKRQTLSQGIWRYRWIYLFLVAPTLLMVFVFNYLTLPGLFLSFMEFRPTYGLDFQYSGPGFLEAPARFLQSILPQNLFSYFNTSEWVGLSHFERLVSEGGFLRAFANTLILSVLKLLIAFPFTILLAILINEVAFRRFRRFLQTILTFPHFLSWVVVSGIVLNLLGDTGAIRKIFLELAPSVADNWNVLYNPDLFRINLVLMDIWKEAGWGTILYLGAMAGIDPEQYEAATVDGCGRVRQIWHVTLPGISGVIVIMFLLQVGTMVNSNFDQVFNLYSPQTYSTGDVIDTYIYRQSFQSSTVNDFGFTTAVGLFKSVINFALLLGANWMARRLGKEGLF